jgi:uncharacterized protein (TIGR00297 family)
MDWEMAPEPEWRKAITPWQDRRQSQWLVGLVGTALVLQLLNTIEYAGTKQLWALLLGTAGVSAVFGLGAWRSRAATPMAAVFGAAICFEITFWTAILTWEDWGVPPGMFWFHSALPALVALFLLTFAATRLGRSRKLAAGLAEPRRGRQVSQVLANLGAAGLLSSQIAADLIGLFQQQDQGFLLIPPLAVAALAEATADTVSSEIGQAFGGRPILLTTLRRVPAGTDGAVSLLGTGAGIGAGAAVVGVSSWTMHYDITTMGILLLSAVTGLFFDSLLGATIERRGKLGNDWVNFLSTAFSAALAFLLLALDTRQH